MGGSLWGIHGGRSVGGSMGEMQGNLWGSSMGDPRGGFRGQGSHTVVRTKMVPVKSHNAFSETFD